VDLFVDFFEFYSNFDFNAHVISVRTGKLLKPVDCLNYCRNLGADGDQWTSDVEFFVEEPFNRSNVAK
jgi:hypothetical protein